MATQSPFGDFITGQGGDPTWYNQTRGMVLKGDPWYRGQKDLTGQLAHGGSGNPYALYGIGGTANTLGYGNLMQLLAGQGRTDPRATNMQRAQIQQSTQGAQMQQQGMAARQGFGNSGVNAALQAGLANAGNARQSDLTARDSQLSEERRRQDLELFRNLIVGPSIDYNALALGQYAQQSQQKQQGKAAKYGAYASLLGSLAGLFCWVADAVLDDKMAVERCRLWMRLYADPVLVDLYREYGPGLAAAAKENPDLAAQLRPLFKAMDENVMFRMAEDGWFGGEA